MESTNPPLDTPLDTSLNTLIDIPLCTQLSTENKRKEGLYQETTINMFNKFILREARWSLPTPRLTPVWNEYSDIQIYSNIFRGIYSFV